MDIVAKRTSGTSVSQPWAFGLSAPDAERAVLGAVLRREEVLADLAGTLEPRHFVDPLHSRIYRAMLELWEERKPVDLVSLSDRLRGAATLDVLSGLMADVFGAANAGYHANLLREAYIRREVARVCDDVLAKAASAEPAVELLQEAEAAIFGIGEAGVVGQAVPWEETLAETSDLIDRWASGDGPVGLRTGFRALDLTLGRLLSLPAPAASAPGPALP